MFDLRAISSVAPLADLTFGITLVLLAFAIANFATLPKLFSRDPRAAKLLLALSICGFAVSVATLAAWPSKLYLAVLYYVVAFTVIGLAVSWRSIGWPQAIARVVGGSTCMFVALSVAYAAAFMPR